jgi:transcriptional regulator with XRE-family HTH domain
MNPAKRARIELELSQSQIAEALGVSQVAVCRWESGHLKPSADNAFRLVYLLAELAYDAGRADLVQSLLGEDVGMLGPIWFPIPEETRAEGIEAEI